MCMSSAFFWCLKVFLRNFKNEYNEIKIQMKIMLLSYFNAQDSYAIKKNNIKTSKKKYFLKIYFSAKYFVFVIIVEMYTCKCEFDS